MELKNVKADNMELNVLDNNFQVSQDITGFLEQAKLDRDIAAEFTNPNKTYRKLATIPDIVALDIKLRYDIDIHDPETMKDPALMKRFRAIIKSDFPKLLSH
jgi:hypothetical protein